MSQMTGHKQTIEGHEYTVYMLSPLVSHELLTDVAKMVGPSLGPAIDVVMGAVQNQSLANLMEQEIDPALFSRALSSLFDRLDKKTMRTLIDAMAGVTHIDGKPVADVFDFHFKGQLGAMYQWLAFAMRVQWGNCFGALASLLQRQGAEADVVPMASRSPSTSTGSSGGS